MSFITDNYRFAKLSSITLLTLIICNVTTVSAFEEKQVRTVNKRVWSIIKGKVKLDKSAYTIKRVKVITPKVELIKPTLPNEKERISADKLSNMTHSQVDYIKKMMNKKKDRPTYLSSIKGSAKSFHENNKEIAKFCSTATASSYCLLEAKAHQPFYGNTPKKKARKINYSDRNTFKKTRESIEFVKKLVKQSNY